MIEKVGSCVRCNKNVFCIDGFFNGVISEKAEIFCFECSAKAKEKGKHQDNFK